MNIVTKVKVKTARILGWMLYGVLKTHGVKQIVITDPSVNEILMEFPLIDIDDICDCDTCNNLLGFGCKSPATVETGKRYCVECLSHPQLEPIDVDFRNEPEIHQAKAPAGIVDTKTSIKQVYEVGSEYHVRRNRT